MSAPHPVQVASGNNPGATMTVAGPQRSDRPHATDSQEVKRAGYGLPCANCKTYYTADLPSCPVCKSSERVSPVVPLPVAPVVAPEESPDPEAIEQERERFLREFNAQVYASQFQASPLPAPNCVKEGNHSGTHQPAVVCQSCYDQLQERLDVLEATLHMDVQEASQIIYDAVWADPSDPNKTYQNAAQALLNELRKRSGITPTFGPLQPLPH